VTHHAQGEGEVHAEGQDHQEHDDGQGEGDVLPDDAPGFAGQSDGKGEQVQVVAHEDHVGRLQGHIGAGAAHGDADVRGGQGRRVVHTVPHHGGEAVLLPHFVQNDHFVLGQQAGVDLVHSHLLRDVGGHSRMVPREHDDFLHAQRLQLANHLGRVGPQGVRDGDESQPLLLGGVVHHHGGFALGLQGLQAVFDFRGEQSRVANPEPAAVHLALHALAHLGPEGGGFRHLQALLLSQAYDGLGDGMLGAAFHRRGQAQEFLFGDPVQGNHVGHPQLAFGQGARFIEGHHNALGKGVPRKRGGSTESTTAAARTNKA